MVMGICRPAPLIVRAEMSCLRGNHPKREKQCTLHQRVVEKVDKAGGNTGAGHNTQPNCHITQLSNG